MLLAVGGDQGDLVGVHVKADVAAADVVHDDHVGALAVELGARSIHPSGAVLGRKPDHQLARPASLAQSRQDIGRGFQLTVQRSPLFVRFPSAGATGR